MFENGIIKRQFPVTSDKITMDYRLTLDGALAMIEDCVSSYHVEYDVCGFDILKKGLIWVISDFNVRLEKEKPYYGDDVFVELWVSDLSPLRIYYDYRLYYKGGKMTERKLFAEGFACWSLVDQASGRPVPCTEMAKDFTVVPDLVFGSHGKYVIIPTEKVLGTSEHKVVTTDLDFNVHVGNLHYVTAVLAHQDPEFYRANTPVGFKIKFMRQTFMGDTLHCQASEKDENTVVYSFRNNAGEEACRVELVWAYTGVPIGAISAHLKGE